MLSVKSLSKFVFFLAIIHVAFSLMSQVAAREQDFKDCFLTIMIFQTGQKNNLTLSDNLEDRAADQESLGLSNTMGPLQALYELESLVIQIRDGQLHESAGWNHRIDRIRSELLARPETFRDLTDELGSSIEQAQAALIQSELTESLKVRLLDLFEQLSFEKSS